MGEYITLRELKNLLPTTEAYDRIPTAKFIRSSGAPLAVYESSDYQIAVYPCGFAIGRSGRRTVGVRVDECRSYRYDVDNSERTAFWNGGDDLQHYFPEDFLLDQPWPLRLMMAVDDQLQKNEDDRERGWISKHSEIPDDKNWMNGGHGSLDDVVIRKMELREVLELMTEKQRRVFVLYGRGYTQQEIGRMVGVPQQVVSKHLRAALEKAKKYYSNNQ
nr:sigma-70 family RNA polymerase sigma factor [Clostridia bacterium]